MNAHTFTPEAWPHWDEHFSERAEVRHEFSRAAHLGDVAMHALLTPGRARQVRAERAALALRTSEASGLVSVPTTHTTGRQPSRCGLPSGVALSNVNASTADLAAALGAFELDASARRLSQLRCAVGFSARAHGVSTKGARTDTAYMVTLTYRGDNRDWRREHVTKAFNALRMWCKRQGFSCRYVWVAELQKRGVIHYHAVVWLPVGVRMPQWDVRGWWPHGMSNRKVVRKSAVGYLMKYLSKGTDMSAGTFPKGARVYGVGGLDHAGRRARRWLRLPAFVQGNSSVNDAWERRTGGGWISPSGRHFPSEFEAIRVGGRRMLARVHRHPVSIEASGPFSWCSDRDRVLAAISAAVH